MCVLVKLGAAINRLWGASSDVPQKDVKSLVSHSTEPIPVSFATNGFVF